MSNTLLDYMATRNYNRSRIFCFFFFSFLFKISPGYLQPKHTNKYTNLRLPVGGVAYGTPKYASTVGLLRTMRPRSSPYLVFTVFELYLRLCTALLAWHDQIGRHIRIVVSNSSVCFVDLKLLPPPAPHPVRLFEETPPLLPLPTPLPP